MPRTSPRPTWGVHTQERHTVFRDPYLSGSGYLERGEILRGRACSGWVVNRIGTGYLRAAGDPAAGPELGKTPEWEFQGTLLQLWSRPLQAVSGASWKASGFYPSFPSSPHSCCPIPCLASWLWNRKDVLSPWMLIFTISVSLSSFFPLFPLFS